MIVYHGTTLDIKEPKILRSEIGRDFGFAFCTERSLHSLKFIDSYAVRKQGE